MSDPRSSTVYDYTSLRLHRNGRRVAQSDDNYTLSKYRRYAVKDSSGNWIAKDAGGLGTVRMRFGKRIAARDGDGECVSIESEGVGQERARQREQEDGWLLVEKERKLGYRARNRRDFEEDLDFLDASQHSSSMSAFGQKPCLPVPSSDLLKSIHYFTASLYTERGELLNLGKLYRAEKKLRSKSRMRQKKRRRVQKDDDDLRDGGDEEHDSDQAFSDPSSSSKPKTLHHPATHARKKHQQDMYRVMDGSALMALGMIMQEHVAMLVQGKMPDGWEEEMTQAHEPQEEDEDEEAGSTEDDDEDSDEEIDGSSDEGADEEAEKYSGDDSDEEIDSNLDNGTNEEAEKDSGNDSGKCDNSSAKDDEEVEFDEDEYSDGNEEEEVSALLQ